MSRQGAYSACMADSFLALQVFLKQDLLENFLEDVSVLHGELLLP